MGRALIVLNGKVDREKAIHWAKAAPPGTRIEFKSSKRTLAQNDRLWACLTEISQKVEWYGQKLPPDDWKDIFTAALRKARVVPGLDAGTFVPLGMRTSDMGKDEFSDLLELINAFAAERGILFEDSSGEPHPSDDGSGNSSMSPEEPAADNSAQQSGPEAGASTEDALSLDDEGQHSAETAPASESNRKPQECLEAFLKTASDPDLSVQKRRELLETMKDWWKAELADHLDFVRSCLQMAEKVAKGDLQAEGARRYLEGLING